MDKLFKDNSINGKIRNKLFILYNFDYKMEIFVNVSKYFKSNLYYASRIMHLRWLVGLFPFTKLSLLEVVLNILQCKQPKLIYQF